MGSSAAFRRVRLCERRADREPVRVKICLRSAARRGRRAGALVTLALLAAVSAAQPGPAFEEAGQLFIQNFSVEDYGAYAQNFSIVQGPNELIYVANASGVLEHDGVSWRVIPISNRSVARSLAVGPGERIYVGAVDELGYLAPDAEGRMGYVSLVDRITDPEDRQLGHVWSVASTSDGVYFQTYERLLRWDGEKITVWRAETRFASCFAVADSLYIQQDHRGLMRLQDGSLVQAPGGNLFRDKTVEASVALGEHAYLVATGQHGLFECSTSQDGCSPLSPGLTGLLTESQPYNAAAAPGGVLAIATLRGGLLLLDHAGRLLRIVDEDAGLRSEFVLATYADRQGGLWLGLNDGIARVEIDPSVSFWDKKSAQMGDVLDVARHRGQIYAATELGVYRLDGGSGGAAARFVPLAGISTVCWSLLSTPQGMLAGCNRGVFNVDRGEKIFSTAEGIVFRVFRGRKDPNSLYLGLYDGFGRMRLRDGRWSDFQQIEGAEFRRVRSIVEDPDGHVWLGSDTDGLLRLEPAASWTTESTLTRFGVADGLPEGACFLQMLGGRLAVTGATGLLRLAASGKFERDSTFDVLLPEGSDGIDDASEDDEGRVWIAADTASGVALPVEGGGYRWQPIRLRRAPMKDVYVMKAETGGPVWVSSSLSGLIRYAPDRSHAAVPDYPVWIRRVTTAAGDLRYDGGPADASSDGSYQEWSFEDWSYQDNAMRFEYAAPRFDAPERTRYRVRLEGQDDGWSAWSDEPHRDYTNLWEGSYVFRVQARDVYGVLSREHSFSFRILPPWYRSWWAYCLYALALMLAVAGFVRSQQRKFERERAVNVQLRQVDRLKDEFLAATSHELRTPLYGITGLAESLAGGAKGEPPAPMREDLEMIASSGRRLSSLVDDILDFSKMRRAELALDRQPVELHSLADIVLTLSRPLVGGKEVELVNAVAVDLPLALADENRVQQILHNLVGNAIKFTETGRVEVGARQRDGQLVVEVADTGIGVADEYRERIFGAFEQADGAVDRRFGGTGLGLAVSRQLIELHGGELWLDSTSPEGSTFAFTLPVAGEATREEPAGVASEGATAVVDAVSQGPADSEVPAFAAASTEGRRSGEGRRTNGQAHILVVDDEPVNRQVLANQLEAVGYRIVAVADGPEALRRIEEQHFDLVLLDVMMPRMSGYEVCRALRERYPAQDLPVLFLTAKTRIEDQVTGLAEGANDYLTKPVPKDALLARVRTQIELLTAHRKQLAGLVPICAECKKIRDDDGYWEQIESFIASRSDLVFSHGMCPPCTEAFIARLQTEDSN